VGVVAGLEELTLPDLGSAPMRLDRHILARFLGNFVVLMAIVFLLAVALDVILQLDEFVSAARRAASEEGRFGSVATALVVAILDFHGPRFFQFFGWMSGLVSIGAMGFTLAAMVRSRELVAMMASGVGLLRVAMVLLAGAFLLNLVQVLNGELVVPRLAPRLLRHHDAILRTGIERFEVPLTRDGGNALLRAASFDPASERLEGILVLKRDESGRVTERVSARAGSWSEVDGGWSLEEGVLLEVAPLAVASGEPMRQERPVSFVGTDLGPQSLLVRRSAPFASMLSLAEISRLRENAGPERDRLARAAYGRFGQVAVNLLVLLVAVPCLLVREPRPLLGGAIAATAIGVAGILGSVALMAIELPGVPAAISAFLPAAVLLPIAVMRLGSLRS
jgi:lipopolysaccharide export LptBFGC system permease protein LptF